MPMAMQLGEKKYRANKTIKHQSQGYASTSVNPFNMKREPKKANQMKKKNAFLGKSGGLENTSFFQTGSQQGHHTANGSPKPTPK